MPKLSLYFLIFTASGFSGLIYESIWTHYLKLFLGHAAYAQTLVLAIFMGGMALGAWLCGRLSTGWRNLLWGYAIVEASIGLLALLFHPLFTGVTGWVMADVLPAVGADGSALAKWGIGTLLILPQSILLGMTFPLMTAGIIRRHPQGQGATIATLYFVNSLGGALGVLASGFWLIDLLGLPGTIALAGIINLLLAAIVAGLSRQQAERPIAPETPDQSADAAGLRPLLLVACLTGLSSFIYEIGWIRMLSLVLGSSTHAFELMLSAFILGLALGGFWIRQRLDRIASPVGFLGWVQIVMGACALATLPLYHGTFDLMQWLMGATAKSPLGYAQFSLASHAIAMLIMLPAAFCAGMTLPLATRALMRAGQGERAIGQVYGANTIGAILGIVFAVHVGLPLLGVKHLIVVGALVDIALGLWLLQRIGGISPTFVKAAAGSIGLVVVVVGLGSFDPLRLASGVFRAGQSIMTPATARMLFHQDGKTATISLIERADQVREIRTNGKADASIAFAADTGYQLDEVTMVMIGALPLVLKPDAKKIANIGMGSGLTSHTILAHPSVEQLDTIEIEPAMVAGAKGFQPRNRRVFEDPRSQIVIEDAKSYFSSRQGSYDIIVSEPSNPWVSGVSSLFSKEFYAHAQKHLAPDGILLQWLHLYEIDESLVVSIIKAIDATFADYTIYAANYGDLLIVATPKGTLPILPVALPDTPLAQELRRIDIATPHDLYAHLVGTRRILQPWLQAHAIAANSDYAPVLDQRAGRARFMGHNASKLALLGMEPLPLLEILDPAVLRQRPAGSTQVTASPHLGKAHPSVAATQVRDALRESARPPPALLQRCALPPGGDKVHAMLDFAFEVLPFLSVDEVAGLWPHLSTLPCMSNPNPVESNWLALLQAIGRRDATAMASQGLRLLEQKQDNTAARRKYLLAGTLLGLIGSDQHPQALALWQRLGKDTFPGEIPFLFRLLVAHATHGGAK